jgi:excisionase family DNA binding protein
MAMAKKISVEDLISLAEAARLRGVSRQAIDDLVKRGKIQTVEIAGRRLVNKQDVEGYEQEIGGRPRKSEADEVKSSTGVAVTTKSKAKAK